MGQTTKELAPETPADTLPQEINGIFCLINSFHRWVVIVLLLTINHLLNQQIFSKLVKTLE
jgi:hypothetical protein